MNTIHDLGGMDGLTIPERDQGRILKEDWERQIWGLALAVWSKPIPGYAEADCIPISVDDVRASVKWRERASVAELRGRPVKLRFVLRNARLYSYMTA